MEREYPLNADGWISFGWNTIRRRKFEVYKGVAVLVGYQIILYIIDFMPGGVVVSTLIQISAGLALSVGWLQYCLKIVRGQEVSIHNIFDGFKRFADVWILSIGLSLAVFVGLLFFIIPGIYVLVRYGLCLLAILDRDLPPIRSYNYSSQITEGHRPQLAIIYLIAIGLYTLTVIPIIAGYQNIGMAALVVYNFVVTPMVSLTLASAYDGLVYASSSPAPDRSV